MQSQIILEKQLVEKIIKMFTFGLKVALLQNEKALALDLKGVTHDET